MNQWVVFLLSRTSLFLFHLLCFYPLHVPRSIMNPVSMTKIHDTGLMINDNMYYSTNRKQHSNHTDIDSIESTVSIVPFHSTRDMQHGC